MVNMWINFIPMIIKDSYTSKKKLGGGVVLTQIHEVDYLNFFFLNIS